MSNHGSLLTGTTHFRMMNHAEMSDEELIRAAQADPQAFGVLYRRYVERIYAYLYSFTHESAEAEDMTSLTFLSAWKGLGHYREQGTFASWLFRIARNKARDYHRQKHPQVSLDAISSPPGDWDLAAGLEQKEKLQRAAQLIEQLEPEQIELLRLRFSAGLSYAEIGSVVGRSTEATKMAFHRMYQTLRSEWKVLDE